MIGRIQACCDPSPASRRWICFPRVLIERYRAHKEGIEEKTRGGIFLT